MNNPRIARSLALSGVALLVAAFSVPFLSAAPLVMDTDGARPAGSPQVSANLVINELEVRQPGADDGEFVEIVNTANVAVNLAGFALVGVDGDGTPYRRDRLPTRLLPPGHYFVVGSSGATNVDLVLDGEDLWYDQDAFPNQAAAVAIVENDSDDARLDRAVDSVSYGGSVPGGPLQGGSWTETAGFDPGDPGDTARESMSRQPDATDTDDNGVDFTMRCISPGYKNSAPGAAGCGLASTRTPSPTPDLGASGLVVNEIDYLQTLGVRGDFVEILNVATFPIDLGEYYLLAINGRVMPPVEYRRDRLPAVQLGPGQTIVLGNQAVANVTVDLGITNIWDSGDSLGPMGIAIVHNTGTDPNLDRLVDSLSYEGSLLGGPVLGGTWTEGAGFPDGDRTDEDNVSLSRFPHGSDTDVNNRDWMERCASPGLENSAANVPCAAPPTHTPGSATLTPTATETPSESPTPTNTAEVRETATPTATGDTGPTATPTTAPPGPDRFVVDSVRDDDDLDPADGVCRTRLGNCTLRAALRQSAFRSGLDWLSIEFTGPMDIVVPVDRPLPGLARRFTVLTGAAHFRSGEPGVRIIGPRAGSFVLSESTALGPFGEPSSQLRRDTNGSAQPGAGEDFVGLSMWSDTSLQGVGVMGFDIGVEITEGSARARVGSNEDGLVDEREGVLIQTNTSHGVVIENRARSVVLADNVIRGHGGYGVLAWDGRHVLDGRPLWGNRFTGNRISESGSGAIGFFPAAPEIARPEVRGADLSRGIVGGRGCAGCRVEVFADDADEAATYLGSATADSVGLWQATGVDLTGVLNLTASATDGVSNTSRLSAPYPAVTPWGVVDVTPFRPRLIFENLIMKRVLRVLDDRQRPIPDARLEFEPSLISATTDSAGKARLEIPIPLLVDPGQSAAFSLSRVVGPSGPRASRWSPAFVVGQGEQGPDPEDTTLELTGLGSLNLGLRFAGRVGATIAAESVAARHGAGSSAVPLQGAEVYGAGMIAAPADLREGATAWQENLAYGGGIYEILAPSPGASGQLEIVAPVEAYNPAGSSAECPGAPDGATIAGWSKDRICWVPVPDSVAAEPGDGAASFVAQAPVTIPAGSTVSILQATVPYTLYTVGFDVTPPVITPTLGAAAPGGQLPAVIALATDLLSGVNTHSIDVRLNGNPLAATYDPATYQIRLEGEPAALPASPPPVLHITLSDGFCNTRTVQITLSGGGTIYLPSTRQR